MKIAKEGDLIKWKSNWDGNIYKSIVSIVMGSEKCYGVYCEYGQDMIPFDEAIIIESI